MKIDLPDVARSKIEDINLRFKTRHPNGVLVAATSEQFTDILMIELNNGAVKVSANYGQGLTSITAGTNLDDNRWHSIHVSRNEDTLILSVDDVDRAEGVYSISLFFRGVGVLSGVSPWCETCREVSHNCS